MTFDPLVAASLLLVGLATGFLAGLLGIGGAVLMVPAVTHVLTTQGVDVQLAVKMAIATSMATIAFTSLSSVRAHHQRGAVRWDLVRTFSPGIVAGGLIAGAGVFALLKGRWLAFFFAAFVSYSAWQMLRPRAAHTDLTMPGRVGQSMVGVAIGFFSGLVGAGGAFISVPFMQRCKVPIHQAVATSAALGFPIALASTVGYVMADFMTPNVVSQVPGAFGYLYLPALALIAVGSVLMAPLGAKAAHALDVKRLRRVFAVALFLLALYMLHRGLSG